MPDELTPAEEFREVAGHFAELVEGASPEAWDHPAPVEGWAARDVVRHLVEWFPSFLQQGAGISLPTGPSVDEDPVGSWRTLQDAVQELLDDPAIETKMLVNRHIGEVPISRAVSQFFTGDVFMHSWDLARATGQDDTLDPERCRELLAGMEPIEELMRSSGQYGPRVEMPEDADVQTRMIAFIGRDPGWGPPTVTA